MPVATLCAHEGRVPGGTGRVQRASRSQRVPRRRPAPVRHRPSGLLARDQRRGGLRRRPAGELPGGIGERDLRPAPAHVPAPGGRRGARPGGSRVARRPRRPARGRPARAVALAGARAVRGVPLVASDRAGPGARHGGRGAHDRRSRATAEDAAIASVDAASNFGLAVLAERIQTEKENFTKFAVLGTEDPGLGPPDKTSMVMAVLDRARARCSARCSRSPSAGSTSTSWSPVRGVARRSST